MQGVWYNSGTFGEVAHCGEGQPKGHETPHSESAYLHSSIMLSDSLRTCGVMWATRRSQNEGSVYDAMRGTCRCHGNFRSCHEFGWSRLTHLRLPAYYFKDCSFMKTISMTIDYTITHLRPREAVLVRFYCKNGCELEEAYLATD